MPTEHEDLTTLARMYGIQTDYHDALGRYVVAGPDSLFGTLQALQVPVEGFADLPEALAERRQELARRLLEPVIVAWDGHAPGIELRPGTATGSLAYHLDLEGGERRAQMMDLASLPEVPPAQDGDRPGRRLTFSEALPPGYHHLTVEVAGKSAHSLILSAPRRCFTGDGKPLWGVFLPLYALRTSRSWGAGDFSDLETLAEWTAGLGGGVVATLPLLAAFLDEPCEPSPYAPASRLFWNELYLDPRRLPEFEDCAAARRLVESPELQREVEVLRAGPRVDYPRLMTLKRRVLEELANRFFSRPGSREEDFAQFVAGKPNLETYAAFRAVGDRRGESWQVWPERLRGGTLASADYDDEDHRYYLWTQWAAEQQMSAMAREARKRGPGLYLDLPLGVHGSAFDVWKERDLFAQEASAGAPPDSLFTKGQNWGFPPLQPERLRERGYDHLIDCLRHHLEHSGILRIDHVMQLHRLFWIPRGMETSAGVYVTYPAEELYAVLALESHRHEAMIVGENLGTVPPEVYGAMDEHDIYGMYVVQYELQPGQGLREPPAKTVASLNTHDMPTFQAYCQAKDADELQSLGFFTPEQAQAERERRAAIRWTLEEALPPEQRGHGAATYDAVLRQRLEHLAASPARMVLVNLEDLWHEAEPQNVPGTHTERPNWQRKARFSFEEFSSRADVVEPLRRVDELRPAKGELVTSPLGEQDLYLFNEGTHFRLYEKLGAHAGTENGEAGTWFAVWAPNAERVSVIGDWNLWDKRADLMTLRGASGIWEAFVPGVLPEISPGVRYKYHIISRYNGYRVDKADPFAFYAEKPPLRASVVWDLDYAWQDADWMATRQDKQSLAAPMSIYEIHLGSWRRVPEDGNRSLTYREAAPLLVEHMQRMGFTHVELLPIMEHPFYGSWGYQSLGYFAASSRYGTPQDLMFLIDTLHQAGIGVILDWVPSHFPGDEHGLAFFDGTHLYEHADPRKGFHPDWASYIFNYGRGEVRSFLISSAVFWLEQFHADGLRVDAVASMLYLDYSRKEGEWIPNEHGGRENLESIAFLRALNDEVGEAAPSAVMIAEESTAWPLVSRPTWVGGLGFHYKWDMGWMHDTLSYFGEDPVYRRYHHKEITFRMVYAFNENFMLPLSHDEVVHGKGSLVNKMPGDLWRKLASLRLLYGYMWSQPGKKILFMGGELAQFREWNHDASLDWHLLEDERHAGVERWLADLNRLYSQEPALHELDCDPAGFEWIDGSDSDNSVISYLRKGKSPGEPILAVLSFTPAPLDNYRIGVPSPGFWREILNSDAEEYGGSGRGNLEGVESEAIPTHGRAHSLSLTLPPLGMIFLQREAVEEDAEEKDLKDDKDTKDDKDEKEIEAEEAGW